MRISPALAVAVLLCTGCAGPATPSVPAGPALSAPILALQALAAEHPDHDDGADPQRDLTGVIPIDLPVPAELGGVQVEAGTVTVTAAGTYRVTGSLADGGLRVHTRDTEPVVLLLDGAWISNPSGPAISVDRADLVVLVAADGSANSLADGPRYAATGADAPTATIDSTADLTITGRGSLTVAGNHAGGISVSAGLVVRDLTLDVRAVADGIRARDYLVIDSGTVSAVAGGDGVVADRAAAGLGYLALGDPTVRVDAAGDGLAAATDLLVAAAELSVTAGGGSTAAVAGGRSPAALRAGSLVVVDDGLLDLDASRHGVASGGTVAINGGNWAISAGDRGLQSDRALFMAGGTVSLAASGGGVAAGAVQVSGGSLEISSDAAGITTRAAGGASGVEGITIEGGEVVVDAVNDPLCGESASLSGGEVVLYASGADGRRCAGLEITGGRLVAGGSAGLGRLPWTGSPQRALVAEVEGGPATVVEFTGPDGEVVATFTGRRPFTRVVASTPDADADATYTVRVDGRAAGRARQE